uniref:TNFR-Cys domain-containing protein n=1 Tax=Amphimedon queenslandica TaxID=400682 RepID=A0A1X7U771_AMPQE
MNSLVRIMYFLLAQTFASLLVSLLSSTIFTHALPLSGCNSTDEFYNMTSGSCRTCTNCSSLGLATLSECGSDNDTICSCPEGHYFNYTIRSCTRCTDCFIDRPRYQTIKQCTATSDAVCQPCQTGYYYVLSYQRCQLNCLACPTGKCETESSEQCQCPQCLVGPLCTVQDTITPACQPDTPTTAPPNTVLTPAYDDQSFSTVSSALIAVGAVMCIVIFSACFVFLGVATSCRKSDSNSETSSSSDGLSASNRIAIVGRSRNAVVSPSLASLYANNRHSPSPLQEYRTSVDLLKFSNSSLYTTGSSNGSWSTIKGSPKASRSNSAPLV